MKKFIEKYGLKDIIRFLITLILYVLWVVWLGSYWLLIGIPVIVDIYLTKKVNWTPWKKREGKNHWLIEWIDALIFAVVAVTLINIFLFQNYKIPTGSMEKSLLIGDRLYVSKVAYGPRLPNTPLSIPFVQNTVPGTSSKSYSELIHWNYKRLHGFRHIKRDDPVVFNFPEGDTVCLQFSETSYYLLILSEAEQLKTRDRYAKVPLKTDAQYKSIARKNFWDKYDIVSRPVDKEDNYIKRCVGIPGDSLQVIDGEVYINGKKQKDYPGIQYKYAVFTGGKEINPKRLEEMGIRDHDIAPSMDRTYEVIPMTNAMAKEMENNRIVQRVQKMIQQKGYYDITIFPHDTNYKWNLDQFGPIYIPKKGATIDLNLKNLSLYKRIIGHYEGNALEVKDSTIYINGEKATSYTFKMNYYWMMGDNRHNSLDSRYWGYVPEDHIIGKPVFVWLSLDEDRHFPFNIRWSRMFMKIK